jgi:Uma2 family endonuclease
MAAATLPFVTIDEYLHTSYEPDADYVDGEIEERNVGEWDHSKLQKYILLALAAFEADGDFLIAQEQRVQVSPTRFRVPDTCVIRAEDEPDRIVTAPPCSASRSYPLRIVPAASTPAASITCAWAYPRSGSSTPKQWPSTS